MFSPSLSGISVHRLVTFEFHLHFGKPKAKNEQTEPSADTNAVPGKNILEQSARPQSTAAELPPTGSYPYGLWAIPRTSNGTLDYSMGGDVTVLNSRKYPFGYDLLRKRKDGGINFDSKITDPDLQWAKIANCQPKILGSNIYPYGFWVIPRSHSGRIEFNSARCDDDAPDFEKYPHGFTVLSRPADGGIKLQKSSSLGSQA